MGNKNLRAFAVVVIASMGISTLLDLVVTIEDYVWLNGDVMTPMERYDQDLADYQFQNDVILESIRDEDDSQMVVGNLAEPVHPYADLSPFQQGLREALAEAGFRTLMSWLSLAYLFVVALLWSIWQYRFFCAAREAGYSGEQTPATSVFVWFVPIGNLLLPLLGLRSLEKALLRPDAQKPLLIVWWCLWIAARQSHRLFVNVDSNAVAGYLTVGVWVLNAGAAIAASMVLLHLHRLLDAVQRRDASLSEVTATVGGYDRG